MDKVLDKCGLVVEPPVIEFMDFFPGQDNVMQQIITFHNRGKRKISLKILKPYSWVFHVNDDGALIFLSPGLSISKKISYKYAHDFSHDLSHESNLPFIIDNEFYYDIPIKVKRGKSVLSVSPLVLNFGMIDLGCRFVAKYLTLTNSGSCAAKFAIDFGSNKLDLLATPKHGQVAPYGVQTVKIEMAGFTAGELFEEFWVKGEPPSRIEVEVHVLFPYLQAIHPNTTGDFTLINFKPTFFGTERYETFIVQNVSSFPSCFVVLAELNNQLFTLNKAVEKVSVYTNFSIHPIEGIIGPFEGHIFTIKFHPHGASSKKKGWKHLKVDEMEFLCFLRVLRVDVVEWHEDGENDPFIGDGGRALLTSDSSPTETVQETDALRICLHGDVAKPEIDVVPDTLHFEGVEVGKEYRKVLRLTNLSSSLPLGFRFKKMTSLYVMPETSFIDPKKSLEITVSFKTASLAFNKKYLTFEMIACHNLTDHRNLKAIDEVRIHISASIISTMMKPQPNFNLGITPAIAHETGIHTETIKYKDIHAKGPKMLLIPNKGLKKRSWLRGDSLIAYPNDMPKSLRVRKNDQNVRTIFTGMKRYVPPVDKECTYTGEEMKSINERNENLMKFYHNKAQRIRKVLVSKEHASFRKRSYSAERLEKLLRPKENETSNIPYKEILKNKLPKPPALLNEICPLTPIHLYNIRVMPKTLDFGKIPPSVNCVKLIRIDNFNDFSVTIKLLLQAKTKEEVFLVAPRSRKEKEIILNLKSYGKFYSNVSYVVNNSHSFDLKLSADVVQRTLSVMPTDLSLSSGKSQFDDIFQVKWGIIKIFNPLYVPTKYSWKVPSGVPFTLEPEEGEVPGNRSIACVAYFNLRKKTVLGTTVYIMVNDGHKIPVRISLIEEKAHNVSVILTKRILPPISLNLPFIETVLLFNSGFKDVVYSVLTPQPLDGVNVQPIVGVIPARACIGLSMDFKMTSIIAFDFHLLVELQGYDIVEAKFIGYVVFPKVEFNPKTIVLRSTPCFSCDTCNLQVENQSPAVVQIQFPLENYPQIKLSCSKNQKNPGLDEDGINILPNNTKELYLHFMPNDLATYELILPFILNEIIGPPLLNNEDTQKPETYITINRENNKLQKYFDLECPSKLSSIHMDCSVAKGYLEFSERQLLFNLNERKEVQRKSITIKNITKCMIHMSFDVTALHPTPFTIVEGPCERNQITNLDPGVSITLTINFKPLFANVFECDLPVFVKEFSDLVPYTLIYIKGVLPKSVIFCATSLIHFLPVPADCYVERSVEVIATHQFSDTKLNCFIRRISGEYPGEDAFSFFYPKGNKIPKNNEPVTLPVMIRFKAKKNLSLRGNIVITDDQDAQCIVQFTACADNAVMSNHMYIFLLHNMQNIAADQKSLSIDTYDKSCLIGLSKISFSEVNPEIVEQILDYPKFPKRTSNSSYALYMRRVLQTMEQWLFEQGFNGSYKMVIGDHVAFSKAYITAAHSRSKTPCHDSVKSIIDLLLNLVGRDLLLQYQFPTTVPEDDSSRIAYSLSIYKQLLQFLKVQGGNICHILPAYLLRYEDYVFYYYEVKMKYIEKSKKGTSFHCQDMFDEKSSTQVFLSEEEFERYNLQSWLDVIMQIHRTIIEAGLPYRNEFKLCMEHISDSPLSPKSTSSRIFSIYSETYELQLLETVPDLKKFNLERAERVLLAWLNLIYNGINFNLDYKKGIDWPDRTIKNLHSDLQDGVILCAVTLFYCPYLEELYFHDFYYDPQDKSQNHHNGVILATAWNAIRLGITVIPSDFYHTNPVFMLILVCHLYMVLRTYIPQASIQFLTCLSQSVTRKISVINSSPFPIGYAIKILGDSNGSFSLEKARPMIVLPAKSSVTITMSFIARTVTPVKAILILSGTCLPSGYANNMVFTLIGDPYKLIVSNDYIISTPIYKPTFINANVYSPYKVEGEYEVWYTEEEPRPGKLHIQKWSAIRQQKVPRILYIGCDRICVPPFNSLYPAVLPLTAACYSLTNCAFWLILRNRDIGDFIIKVHIKPRVGNPFLVLPVRLPEGMCTGYPNTRCSYNCPRTFYIHIPCRSARLWTTVKAMFFLILHPKEHSFWDHHLETRIGLDLIRWMLGDQNVSVAKEIGYLFNSKIKYNVKSHDKALEIEPSVTIEDVHSPGFVQIMAHVCCMVTNDTTANITLESECGKEIRFYQVRFTNPLDTVAKDMTLPCRKCIPPPQKPPLKRYTRNRVSHRPPSHINFNTK